MAWVFPKSSHQQSLKNSAPHRTWHAAFARDKKSSAQTSVDAPLKKFGTARRAAQNPGLVRGWNLGALESGVGSALGSSHSNVRRARSASSARDMFWE